MILNLPKIGSVRFRDDLTAAELEAQVNQLAKKYNFELAESELTTGEMASRAFTRGTKQLGSVVGDIIPAMVAQGLGFDEVAKQQLEEAAQTQEEINKYYAPQYPTLESVKGPLDVPGFALETFVEQIPNLLTSLIPGIGAEVVAARTALGAVSKRLLAEAAEKKLGDAATREFVTQGLKAAAPEVARKAGTAQAAGIYLGSYAQNAPEIFQNIYESTGQMDVGTALLFGAGSAALDSVVPAQIARQLTGPLRVGVVENLLEKSGMDKGVLRSTTSSILRSFPAEFATEGAQEAISLSAEKFVAGNPQIFNSKDWNRIMEASVRGAIAGGGFGAVSGTIEGLRVKAQEKRQQAEQAEQQRKTDEAVRLRKEAQELEDAAAKQTQMELPGIDREGPAASLMKDPQFIAAKAAVDAKKKLMGMEVEPTPKAKPPTGEQLEMFTPEGELTKQAEKAAKSDEKRAAVQKKEDDKRRVEEAKQAAARLRKLLSGTQMTLPGFSPEEIKAEEQQRAALQEEAAKTGQGDLFAGMPTAATTPTPSETLIGSDKDALKAFGKQFGIGPTASILKVDGPLAGKDIANPQDAAEVRRVLEAYAGGKPAAGASEKIAEYLKRPEFQVAEVKDERVATEAVSPGGEPSVPVYSRPEAGVSPTQEPTEPAAVGVEPVSKPTGGAGVRAAPISGALEAKPRGRPKAELTPEQQQEKLEARKGLATESKNAGRRMEKALKTIEAPFDAAKYETEEALSEAVQAEDAKVIDALIDAYRVANDPAQRKNKPGQMAREIIQNPNVTQRQRDIAKARFEREGKPARAEAISKQNVAYHSGDLGYGTDTTLGRMTGGRSTGHFGTGVYFVSNPEYYSDLMGYENRPVEKVDLSGYNLLRPGFDYEAEILHKALSKVNSLANNDEINLNSVEAQRAIRDAAYNIYFATGREKSEAEVSKAIVAAVKEARKLLPKYAFTRDYIDSASTRVVKKLGYEGIDVRHIPKYDNTTYGTVVYTENFTPKRTTQPAKRLPVETTSTLYDDVYYDFADAQAAAKFISQNGSAFERFLSNRLFDSLKGVKLVLVSDPSDVDVPEVKAEFERASPYGVYYKKVIYLNTRDGLDNETFLHEAVHAATIGKITSFETRGYRGQRAHEFLAFSKRTQREAKKYYDSMMARADADPEYALRHANVIYTMRQLAENKSSDIFNNLAEFFSYGLTNKDMQEFLMMAPGMFEYGGIKSLFTRFVESIRKLFGFGPEHKSAFQDLLIVTDQVVKPVKVEEDGSTPLQSINLANSTLKEIGRIGTNMPALTSKTAENFRNTASNLPARLQEMLLGILRLDNINTIYGKDLPSIQNLLDAIEKRYGMQERMIKQVNDNFVKFQEIARAEPAAIERMDNMAYDARLAQVDLLDDSFKPSPAQASEYSRLKGIYNQLPKDVQGIYQTVRKEYDNAIKEYEKILFGDPKTGDVGVVGGLEPSVANKLRLQYEARQRQVGYIPFLRRGEFWVEYTGADDERYVHAFQSVRERQRFIDQYLQGKEHQIYSKLEDADYRKGNIPTTSFIAQLIKNLSDQGASPAQINELYQAYLALFPAESISKQFMKSDNIRGMERDVIRGYGDTMVKWSRKLAASKYIPEIDRAIEGIASEADGKGDIQLDLVVKNIKRQQDFIHNPTYNNVVNALTSFSYLEYIAGNISSAIINISTLPLFSWPMLGGKFGFDKASSALLRGSRISINGMEKDPRYRNLYNELMAHAQLEHTTAREVLEGRRQTTGEFNSLKAKLFDGLSKPFAMAEKLNRGATAIAAYDLAKSSGMSEKDAIRYAITTVKDINTSGMSATAPRWMQTPLGRIFFTFKSFTYNSAFIIARTFHQAFKGESQDVKDMARRQLLGIYAMSYAFSGAKGLPFMSGITTFAEMIASLFGDDDEPIDVQADMRQFLGELGYKGPLNYFLNLEIANRTGIAQDIIYKDDPRGVAENGLFLTALKQSLGPAGSYFWSAERALRDMSEGQALRATEALLPSFARNGLKGWRYMTDGALTAKGDPIDTDINLWNSLAQGVGFAPADLSATYEKLSAAKGYEREVEARRTKILNLYTMARKTGDTDLMSEANERRLKFNAANPQVAITNSTLQRSAQASKAAERNMLYGVRFNPKLRPEIEDKFFDDED